MDGSEDADDLRIFADVEVSMSTLRDDAIADFFLGDDEAGAPDLRGVLSFDCVVHSDGISPIDPTMRTHPEFDQINRVAIASAGSGTAFMPRHLLIIGQPDEEGKTRLMLIGDDVLAGLLAAIASGAKILRSEARLAKQLISGFNLREAASLDGVSHETKRSQYKSLAMKTGARSQGHFVAKLLTQLLIATEASVSKSRTSPGDHLAALVREFIPSARIYSLSGMAGAHHHVIEVGPADGAPFIMIHPQILPDFSSEDLAALEERRRRIVIPLRNGALVQGVEGLDLERHMDHACDGILRVLDKLAIARGDLMGCISGCAYALEFAHRQPQRVGSLALVGACVRPNTGTSTAGRLRSGMLSMAMHNWSIYSRAVDFYGRRIRKPDTCRQLLFNVYRPCHADLAVIEAEYGQPHRGERLRRFFAASVESIKHDFYHQAFPHWEKLDELSVPIAFLHGTHDFIHTLTSVRGIAARSGRSVLSIEGGGQLLYHRHFRPMLDAYVSFVEAPSSRAG